MTDRSDRQGLSRRRVLGAAAAGSAVAVTGFPSVLRAAAPAVKVGLLHPVTGFLSFNGSQSRLGCEMAIADVNARGGIKALGGAKLEAMLSDAQSKVEVGASETAKLVEGGATAVIGVFSSAIGLAATQEAAKTGTPFIIDVGVSDRLVERGLTNVFRFSDGYGRITQQGLEVLDQLNKKAGSPAKSAVLVHEESEFGTGTAKLCAEQLPKMGIEVKDVIKHANPTRDFNNIVLRIKSEKPDLVMASNYQNEYMLLARTLKQQRVDLVAQYSMLGGGFNLKFVKEMPDVAEYIMDFNHWYDPHKPQQADVRKRLEAKGGIYTFEISLSYNSVMLLADALERAGTTDKPKVIEALASSTFAEHGMPYGPTKFEHGQNMGARCVALQALGKEIYPIYPPEVAEKAPVYPRPKA